MSGAPTVAPLLLFQHQVAVMTPSIITLQEVLKHHRGLSPEARVFCETLLNQGDVLGVTLDYLSDSLLWLVTTPGQARLMREGLNQVGDVGAMVLSLPEAQDLLTAVGDLAPATLYEVAEWLLAPAPEEPQSPHDAPDHL